MTTDPSPVTVKRGRPRDERAKRAILEATAALLGKRGYEGVTVEAIAAEAHVGKQTIYRWWPTKAAVVGDAFLEGFVAFPESELAYTTDVWADLGAWMGADDDGFEGRYGDLVRITAAVAASDHSLASCMVEQFAKPSRALLVTRLQHAVTGGQIEPNADLDVIVDILQAVVTYAGLTRADRTVIQNTLAVLQAAVGTSTRRE